jgi:hypothetical protein
LEAGIPTRLTRAEGRKFGLTVGIACAIFGGISLWRGHEVAPFVFWGVGAVLITTGLVMPTKLGPVFAGWMRLASLLSKVVTPVLMGIVYYLAVLPTGFLVRVIKGNPLRRNKSAASFWIQRESTQPSDMTHQF